MSRLRACLLSPLLLAAGCLPALAQAYSNNSSFPGVDALVNLLGYDGLSGDQRDLLAFVLVVFAVGFGYFSHLGFRDSGFGMALNGVIGAAGSCAALYLLGPKFNLLAAVQGRAQDFLRAVLVAGAAVPALIFAAMLASLRRRATINFFFRQSRRKLDAERAAKVTPDLPPRIAALLKK
jgi:hypothetical protein